MATLNGVNSKFQNLSNQLEDIALKRQSSLDNRDHSPGALRWEIGDHEDLANGDMYSRFTLQDDGSFNYLSNDGKTKKWNDYSNTFQKSGVGQEAFTIMGQQAQQDGAYGNKFNKDKYKNLFRDLRQKLKTDGSRDFLFADETFLKELMDKYQVHALEILEELHGGAIKSYNARQSSGGKDQTVLVDGKYMSRNDALNQANTMNTTGSITYSQTNPPIKYENIGNGRTRVYTRKEGTTSNEFIARRVITTEEAIAQRGLNVFNIEIEKYDVQKDQQFLKGQNILDAALKNLPVGTNSVLKKEEE
jgi:hypothetical protein